MSNIIIHYLQAKMLSIGVDNFSVNYEVILNSVILPEFYNTEVNLTITEAIQATIRNNHIHCVGYISTQGQAKTF